MNINENILSSKYKVGLSVKGIDRYQNLNGFLELDAKNLVLTFKANKNSEHAIKHLFQMLSPIFCETEKDKIIYLSYSFIDNLTIDEARKISFHVVNPIYKRKIKMIIYSIEKCNLVFTTKLKYDKILILVKTINEMIAGEKQQMINRIFHFTTNLLNISNGKSLGMIFDNDSLIKSYLEGKKYYDKSIKDLIRQDKIKISINKRIMNQSFYIDNYLSTAYTSEVKYNYAPFDNLIQNIKECLMANVNEFVDLFLDVNLIDKIIIEKGKENIYYPNENANCDHRNYDFKELIYFGSKRKKSDFFLSNSNKQDSRSESVKKNKEDLKIKTETPKKFVIKFNLFEESKNNKNVIKFNSSILDINKINFSKERFFLKENKCELNESKTNNLYKADERRHKSSTVNSPKLDLSIEKTEWSSAEINKTPNFKKRRIDSTESKDKIHISFACDERENKMNCSITKKHLNNRFKIKTQENQDSYDNSVQDKLSYRESYRIKPNNIADKINILRNKHLFSVNSSIDEVFNNTIEVITRKYFEFSFEEYFEKTFIYQKDNNGFLKLDSLFSLFFYMRGLKYLVMQDNLQMDYFEFLENEFEQHIKRMK